MAFTPLQYENPTYPAPPSLLRSRPGVRPRLPLARLDARPRARDREIDHRAPDARSTARDAKSARAGAIFARDVEGADGAMKMRSARRARVV